MPEDTPLLKALQTLFGAEEFTEQDFDKDIFMKNAAAVKKQADGLPLFYTEWNLSANFGSPMQDSRKVAAYDVRTALGIEDIVDGDGTYYIFEEIEEDGEQQLAEVEDEDLLDELAEIFESRFDELYDDEDEEE